MKTRLAALLIVAIVVPACDTPPFRATTTFDPTGTTFVRAAKLSGRQEVPPNLSTATGDATVEIDAGRLVVTVTVNFTGLVDTTEAHIHVGGVGVDGPIIFPLALRPFTSPLVVVLSQDTLIARPEIEVRTFSDAVDAISAGRTYINLHTASFPEGEIRSQVGPVTMLALLNGQQEVPSVLTTATGSMNLMLNSDQTVMTFSLAFTGLTNTTAAHIHAAPAQVDGPIIFPLAVGVIFPPLSGTLTATELTPQPGVTTFPEAVDAVLSGNTYVNVHTALYVDGEIRGQILGFVSPPPPPVVIPPTTPPITVAPPIPGYPNTVGTILGTPSQGYPNTGVVTPSTLNPGFFTTGSPGVGTVTTGTPNSPTGPIIVSPVYSDSSALKR